MRLEAFDVAHRKAMARRANGLAGRHVRTLQELADEFGTTYQALVFAMKKHPDGVPKPVHSHTASQNRDISRYDLLLMRVWWKGLKK